MADALVGFSGFVGETLLRQRGFDAKYRSTNIGEIDGQSFETLVCAGAPAQKWIANREPVADAQNIRGLISHLETVQCQRFVLISTVDVYSQSCAVDEDTEVRLDGLHPYGLHRYWLEEFVRNRFAEHLIIRLPGLVGPRLRKNIIFDMLHDNNPAAVDSRSRFQFYPMVNLWRDIEIALESQPREFNFAVEPVTVAEVARLGFGREFTNILPGAPVVYDMHSRHAALFGGEGRYLYSARESLQAIRAYAQSEPLVGCQRDAKEKS